MKYTPLSPADVATLDSDRDFVTAVVKARFAGERLSGTQRDLPLLQRILDFGPYTASDEEALMALGTTFGDLLSRALGMTWIRFTNEQGEALALRYADSFIVTFPRDMIIRRVESDEHPDLQHIYSGVIAEVQKLVASGKFQ